MPKIVYSKSITVFCAVVVLIASYQLAYADGNSFTVNVPNNQGGYTSVVIQPSGSGYIGPQGEYYTQFPSVAQLKAMYGANPSNVVSEVIVTVPPPALPDYVQPDPPDPGDIWTPGYWAYDSFLEDYYWVPGTWVQAPEPGYLWTPGYWYWREGHFIFSDGYWGIHIGFYGGVHYGHGYDGRGFSGGSWHNGVFANRTINVTNVTNINNNTTINNASFNGGPGGIQAQPTPFEQTAMKERHRPWTAQQKTHFQASLSNPSLRASANHGRPGIVATAWPGVFKGKGVVTTIRNQNKFIPYKPQPKPKLKPKPKPKSKPKLPIPPTDGGNWQGKNQ